MPAARRCAQAGIAVFVALMGAGAGLLAGGHAGALASGTSSAPSAAPAGISLPGLGVTVPAIGVSVPGIGVTVPSVGVTLPGVTVSTPAVTVSTPEVGVSTPQVSVSTPTQSGSSPSETTTGGGTQTSPTGGGTGTSPTAPPTSTIRYSGSGDSASAASVAAGASHTAAAATVHRTPAGRAGEGARAGGLRRARQDRRQRHSGGAAATIGAAGGGALALARSSPPGADRTSRSAGHGSSNPLDTIGGQIPLPLPVPDWSKPIILALLLLALWLGVRSRMAARRAGRLERQRAGLLRDVGAMQAALVPEIPARVGGLAVSVAYRPAEGPAAGGDFYDVFVPERGRVAVILGDVAGHGHRALTRAALTRYTLRAYLQAGLEPRAALALAGRVLADPSAEHFATVVLGVYDTREGLLTLASAGHPAPILHGLQTRQPLTVCASPPVGWTVPTGRRQTTVSLAPGAIVCFFTDGLIEARGKEEMLGRERLDEIVGELGPRPDAAKLLARVRAATLATPDDMAACILAPEMTVIAPRTHIEELEADARALAGGQARRFLESCQVPTDDIEHAIESASDLASMFGSALLRVELSEADAAVTVAAPTSGSQGAMAEQPQQPADEPSGVR